MVVLLLGQSNMAGRAPLAPRDRQPIRCALLLDPKRRWERARHPLNRYASDPFLVDGSAHGLGPGGAFASALCQEVPGLRVGLVVNARSTSNIARWAKGQRLYENTLERAREIPAAKLWGVLWHQGEADAQNPHYYIDLLRLIRDLRRDLEKPDLRFIAGEVAGESAINDQLVMVADRLANFAIVSAEGLSTIDGVHFDREGQIGLGQRYARALLDLSLPLPPDGPPRAKLAP